MVARCHWPQLTVTTQSGFTNSINLAIPAKRVVPAVDNRNKSM